MLFLALVGLIALALYTLSYKIMVAFLFGLVLGAFAHDSMCRPKP